VELIIDCNYSNYAVMEEDLPFSWKSPVEGKELPRERQITCQKSPKSNLLF
jgi:hypothetical protein